MANIFDNIRNNAGDSAKSYTWYQDQIKRLGSTRPESLLKGSSLTSTIIPGKMYLFAYDPKFKNVLPYYDKFPLVFPFRKVKGGFFGINIHYLPYLARFKLLGALTDLISSNESDDTKLNLSWRILVASSKFSAAQACVKHYLTQHIESRFLNIPYQDWLTASQLPIERFVGADKSQVWRDSKAKY